MEREVQTRRFETLSEIYDREPYKSISAERALKVLRFLQRTSFQCNPVLDVGCGTGIGSNVYEKAGYGVVGIDLSRQALILAHGKRIPSEKCLFVQQDMRYLGFSDCTFGLVSCLFDTLNYLSSEEELQLFLKDSYRVLKTGGTIALDYLTTAAFSDIETQPDTFFKGDGFYYASKAVLGTKNSVSLDLTAFIKERENLFRCLEEKHELYLFDDNIVSRALLGVGFNLLGFYDGEECDLPSTPASWHVFAFAQKI